MGLHGEMMASEPAMALAVDLVDPTCGTWRLHTPGHDHTHMPRYTTLWDHLRAVSLVVPRA